MLAALDALDADVVSGAFTPTIADEDVHTALERGLHGTGGRRTRRPAAGRPVAQRPGGHAVPDVAAGRGPPGRRRHAGRRRRPRRPRDDPPGRRPARPYPPAARPAGAARAPPAGARAVAAAGRVPPGRLGPPHRPVPVRLAVRWPARHWASTRSTVAKELGFDGAGGELHRRHRVPRLRRRGRVLLRHARRGPVQDRRGGHHLDDRRVRLRGARRRVGHRQFDHAAEEEPGRRRADQGQVRPPDRQPDRSAGHAEGAAAGVQQGSAGGQGTAVRLRRAVGTAAARDQPACSPR